MENFAVTPLCVEMFEPLISIVIPHFNRPELLRLTLESIYFQKHKDWEVVVVDDGSEVSSYEKAESLASEKVKVIRRGDGAKGPSRCRNLGVQHCTGELVIFLDSDDLMSDICLASRHSEVRASPDNDLWIFPAGVFKEQQGDSTELWAELVHPRPPLERFLMSDNPWCVSSGIWRKNAFISIGGFNDNVFYGDDSELHIRAILDGLRIKEHPNSPVDNYVRRSDVARITNGLSENLVRSRLVRLRTVTSVLRSHDVSNSLLKIWEGQYFVEGEFLLFKGIATEYLLLLISAWRNDFPEASQRQISAQFYLRLAFLSRRRSRLLIRLLRRIAILFLPSTWFPERLAT